MLYWFDTEFLEDGTTIVPISIGIIAEDGRELYIEFDLPQEQWDRIHAHQWLMENVYPHLNLNRTTFDDARIQIRQFVTGHDPRFWAYCGAYDWVLINQLYGSMVDHPTKWPFFCNDIAQLAEHLGVNRRTQLPVQEGPAHNALADAKWVRDAYYQLTNFMAKGD